MLFDGTGHDELEKGLVVLDVGERDELVGELVSEELEPDELLDVEAVRRRQATFEVSRRVEEAREQ